MSNNKKLTPAEKGQQIELQAILIGCMFFGIKRVKQGTFEILVNTKNGNNFRVSQN